MCFRRGNPNPASGANFWLCGPKLNSTPACSTSRRSMVAPQSGGPHPLELEPTPAGARLGHAKHSTEGQVAGISTVPWLCGVNEHGLDPNVGGQRRGTAQGNRQDSTVCARGKSICLAKFAPECQVVTQMVNIFVTSLNFVNTKYMCCNRSISWHALCIVRLRERKDAMTYTVEELVMDMDVRHVGAVTPEPVMGEEPDTYLVVTYTDGTEAVFIRSRRGSGWVWAEPHYRSLAE